MGKLPPLISAVVVAFAAYSAIGIAAQEAPSRPGAILKPTAAVP
jgi:hypothetical protein